MSSRPLVIAAALAILAVIDLAPAAGVARAQVSSGSPIEIVTVPKGRHLRLELAGRTYTTDRRGRTTIPAADVQRLPFRLRAQRLLLAEQIKLLPHRRPDGSRFRIERWYSKGNMAKPRLHAAINLYRPIRFSLVSRTGHPISLALLDSFRMRRIDGAETDLTPDQLSRPVLLQANRVVPLNGALVSKKLLYRIQRVSVGGNNVVNRAQQAFSPSDTRTVRVRLLFYAVRIQARDTLFGFPIGSGIRLVYPNRQERVHRFQGDGEVTLSALPRGTYHVSVNAPGLSPSTPVSITRDHVTRLEVLSYLDIAVLAVGFVGLIVGLALLRRRALRQRLSRLPRLQRRRALRRSG
jgi:hypothetical protein